MTKHLPESLALASRADVLGWGWDGAKLLQELIRIDYATMEGITSEHEGSVEQWAPVFMEHPESWRLIVTEAGQIVGYWHMPALREQSFARALAGELFDSEIDREAVASFEGLGPFDLYLVSIVLLPNARSREARQLLYGSLLAQVEAILNRGCEIRKICTQAITSSGTRTLERLGFRTLCRHADNGVMMTVEASELVARLRDVLKEPSRCEPGHVRKAHQPAGAPMVSKIGLDEFEIKVLNGRETHPYLKELGALRIEVFHDYPYLYDGTVAYEEKYLRTYFEDPDSLLVLALHEGKIVGASTGVPLTAESEEFRDNFARHGFDPDRVFYYGESVLQRNYRGYGLGNVFFKEREAYARRLGRFTNVSFCGVVRDEKDPRQPEGYRILHGLWEKHGFRAVPGLTATLSWKEIGESEESPKTMQFWIKAL